MSRPDREGGWNAERSILDERFPDLPDGDRYTNGEIAQRMWQTYNVTGDRWFKYAAQRLEKIAR